MRVVSLVPSATETLLALGVEPIACTRFCEQPGIATVGGTKNPNVDEIVALSPDLVVMNDEENRREDHHALVGAGVAVHSMSPRAVVDVGRAVEALAHRVGAHPAYAPLVSRPEWLAAAEAARPAPRSCVTFVWRRPWMTLAADTYGASLLDLLGLEQIAFATGDRYPTVTLDDVALRAPDVALLPSEPYVFRERHRDEVAQALAGATVVLVDGRDLFWWGSRTPQAVERLHAALT